MHPDDYLPLSGLQHFAFLPITCWPGICGATWMLIRPFRGNAVPPRKGRVD